MKEDDRMIAEVQKFQNAEATIMNDLRVTAIPSRTRRVISDSGENCFRKQLKNCPNETIKQKREKLFCADVERRPEANQSESRRYRGSILLGTVARYR
ncbi:hypothetical protein IEQ34_014096 [Dendrobium chrysotoxum]|uniref:Uncharacterized protein n=1 Tax=Dendrobium chrysotoxum TaxID=161865 RepID=A0AAV7GKE9_DENCH|nr:hypothetical protein IEQ34_014096 [Dendrobium chrysotoxum]